MRVRILLTGVSGFAGSHLAEYIHAGHPQALLYGTYRPRSRLDNLRTLAQADALEIVEGSIVPERESRGLTLVQCDLTDASAVDRLVSQVRPDRVFHLAAQSFVQSSFAEPAATIATNVLAQVHLLEALRRHAPDARVLVAGSSEEYGLVRADEVPIRETNELRPLSPYAVSKIAQDRLGYQYFRSYGMHVVITRAFNHTGPRRGSVFAESSFARQVAEIERGRRAAVVRVGDLAPERDWHDVRDTVRGYWLALERGEPGEVYNLGSGRSRSVREVLSLLGGLSGKKFEIQEDPARFRPSDVPLLCADAAKFAQRTGWQATIPFERTLRDLLDWWRERIGESEVGPWI